MIKVAGQRVLVPHTFSGGELGPEVSGALMWLPFETLLGFHVLVFIVTSSSSSPCAKP